MKIIIGHIKEVEDRHLIVALPNKETIKTIRANPLSLDEREQKPNIKIGMECITLYDERTGTGITCFSLSQAIELSDKISRIENDLVLIYGKDIKIMNATGDNKDTMEKIADSITVHAKTFKLKSESEELISVLLELLDKLIGIKVVNQAIHKLAPIETLDPSTIAALSAIKVKLQTFK